jgi:hypothetical protein
MVVHCKCYSLYILYILPYILFSESLFNQCHEQSFGHMDGSYQLCLQLRITTRYI